MKPTGAGSVMADRAPDVVAADDPQTALYRKLEYFPTPPWAARAGGELVKRFDPEALIAWEPCCGGGHMVHGLSDYFTHIFATDIHDHGAACQSLPPLDFTSADADAIETEWAFANPPFTLAAEFVRLGLRRASRGVAILQRASWYETDGRYPLFYGETPLSLYAPFFDRVPMHLGRWEPKGGTATAYAWFLFMKPAVEPPEISALREALGCAATIGIPPGTKRRLTRADDARLFGAAKPAPLFEGFE